MNSLCLCTIFSCLFAVTTQQSRTARNLPNSDPPYPKLHPRHWAGSANTRELYIFNKQNNWFIQMTHDGTISGTRLKNKTAIIMMMSGGNQTVIMKGQEADMYLCMDRDARIYATTSLEKDCYFVEKYHDNLYNTYHHSLHRRGDKKNYLAIDDNGKMTVVNSANDQKVFFLPLSLTSTEVAIVTTTTTTTARPVTTTTRTIPTTSTVAPNLKKLEKTRKRRRRWCKLLIRGRLEKKPAKYLKRCKHDCNILQTMLDNIKRYKRKCEKQRQRRRRRNRKKRQKKQGVSHSIRHGGRRTKHRRGRGRDKKLTTVKATPSPNVDVT